MMPKLLPILVLPSLLALGFSPIHAENLPITVDGDLTVEEWQEGADEITTGEGWARLSHREDGLYLAVRSNIIAMVDVMLQRGDTLRQLHVSGQVGDALFERGEDGLWRLKRTYPWIGDIQDRKVIEEKRREALQKRLAGLSGKKKPSGEVSETGSTRPKPPVSTPPTAQPAPTPQPTPTPSSRPTNPAEKAEATARHLKERGWTGTMSSKSSSKTAELFISNELLRPGDRILITWPHRGEDRSFTKTIFPAGAEPMSDDHSAAHKIEPFTHDFANWYVVE